MRSACDSSPARPLKTPSALSGGPAQPIAHHSSPTTFFLRSERDMLGSDSTRPADGTAIDGSSYGVQSLNDVPTDSHISSPKLPPSDKPEAPNNRASSSSSDRKKYPVHPKIVAAAQRILGSDDALSPPSSTFPGALSCPSPFRAHFRSRSSTSRNPSVSPLHLGHQHHLTESPDPHRTSSVRSLALSDEEGSMLDDWDSQPVHSSSEDEQDPEDMPASNPDAIRPGAAQTGSSVPQLVMPSLSMPQRRPFTARGNDMGRFRVLVMGPKNVGKTCLIRTMMQHCQDIVHIDPGTAASTASLQQWPTGARHAQNNYVATDEILEINASTRAYPHWWSETETSGRSQRRRSTGAAVLDRNICFVDTPGWSNTGFEHENMQAASDDIVAYLENLLLRNTNLGLSEDSEVLGSLCGGGGLQVDAIIYMFRPTTMHISTEELGVLRRLSSITNVIPAIGKCDTRDEGEVRDAKASLKSALTSAGIGTFTFPTITSGDGTASAEPREKAIQAPYILSSALEDDSDVMDASVLMSPSYSRGLTHSELPELTRQLLEPDNIRWLRHCAVRKFLTWRREQHGISIISHKHELWALSPDQRHCDSESGITSSHAEWSMISRQSVNTDSMYNGSVGSKTLHMRLPIGTATWAQSLQQALDDERRRIVQHRDDRQIVPLKQQTGLIAAKKKNGRRGLRDLSVIPPADPYERDPLGVLAMSESLSKQGWIALQVAGSCGILATVAVWVVRNWSDVASSFGLKSEMHNQIPRGYAPLGYRDEWKGLFWL